MPRGVKRVRNLSEEIETVKKQIAKHESAVKSLKAKLSSLEKEHEQSELKQLNDYLKEKGLSAQDLVEAVIKQNWDENE